MPPRLDLSVLVSQLVGDRSASLDRVLDAARDCFLEHGVAGTTMADVAERAGVSRVWVHRVAGSRDELLHAVLAREIEGLLGLLVIMRPSEPDPVAALGDAFGVVVSHFASHPLVRRLVDHESNLILPALMRDSSIVTLLTERVAAAYGAYTGTDPATLRDLAEVVVRLGVSLVVVPRRTGGDTPADLSALVRAVLGPTAATLVIEGSTHADV